VAVPCNEFDALWIGDLQIREAAGIQQPPNIPEQSRCAGDVFGDVVAGDQIEGPQAFLNIRVQRIHFVNDNGQPAVSDILAAKVGAQRIGFDAHGGSSPPRGGNGEAAVAATYIQVPRPSQPLVLLEVAHQFPAAHIGRERKIEPHPMRLR
jgi:hypothetical protein